MSAPDWRLLRCDEDLFLGTPHDDGYTNVWCPRKPVSSIAPEFERLPLYFVAAYVSADRLELCSQLALNVREFKFSVAPRTWVYEWHNALWCALDGDQVKAAMATPEADNAASRRFAEFWRSLSAQHAWKRSGGNSLSKAVPLEDLHMTWQPGSAHAL